MPLVSHGEQHIICLGVPENDNSKVSLRFVLRKTQVVVIRS